MIFILENSLNIFFILFFDNFALLHSVFVSYSPLLQFLLGQSSTSLSQCNVLYIMLCFYFWVITQFIYLNLHIYSWVLDHSPEFGPLLWKSDSYNHPARGGPHEPLPDQRGTVGWLHRVPVNTMDSVNSWVQWPCHVQTLFSGNLPQDLVFLCISLLSSILFTK